MPGEHWVDSHIDRDLVASLTTEHGLSRPTAMMLAGRAIVPEDLDRFMFPKLRQLGDPYALPGAEAAAARLWQAVRQRERILIHGDYDTDGITAAALLAWVLEQNGAVVDIFLPNRLSDGYGLSEAVVERAVGDGTRLMVTVDCGISANAPAARARELGLDLIITDHHQPGAELPAAYACLNPKLHPDQTEIRDLAGVGVCFKLCHAFVKYGRERHIGAFDFDLRQGMDLVALGTVADIVPLLGENRCLVKYGIEVLARQRRPGIRALCEAARVQERVRSQDIAFYLAPRLNAAGRLGRAEDALALLRADSMVDAYALAARLDGYNGERKSYERDVLRAAMAQAEQQEPADRFSIVVAAAGWHPGVIGIVASRLTREFHRPSLVLSLDEDGVLNGSGRSVPGVDMVAALDTCADCLIRYGGHPMAVGLSLAEPHLEPFRQRFEAAVHSQCDGSLPARQLHCDGEVLFDELDDKFFGELEHLQPFGHAYRAPVFRFTGVNADGLRGFGRGNTRGLISDASGRRLPFIFFGRSPADLPRGPWHLAGTPEMNLRTASAYPQIHVVDIRGADREGGGGPSAAS